MACLPQQGKQRLFKKYNVIIYWFFGNFPLCNSIPITSRFLHNGPTPHHGRGRTGTDGLGLGELTLPTPEWNSPSDLERRAQLLSRPISRVLGWFTLSHLWPAGVREAETLFYWGRLYKYTQGRLGPTHRGRHVPGCGLLEVIHLLHTLSFFSEQREYFSKQLVIELAMFTLDHF